MTMVTEDAPECGAMMRRAALMALVWWTGFVGALWAIWSYSPEARDALVYGFHWLARGMAS